MTINFKQITLITLAVGLLTAAYLAYVNEKPGYRIELEGLYLDKNLRDMGASLNECAAKLNIPLHFNEGKLLRANKWFSGWSCEDVGNPDAIITLNYQPERQWQFYCNKDNGEKLIGYHGNSSQEMSNIEFLNTWELTSNVEDICRHLDAIIYAAVHDEKTLFHCEAGRDRTGAVAAILTAIAIESASTSWDKTTYELIECDYRKSASLKEHKYGRMQDFISKVRVKDGSMTEFIHRQCELPKKLLREFGTKFLPSGHP